MKIALTGVHGCGKTTILNEMLNDLYYTKFKKYRSFTRRLQEQGFNIGEKGDDVTQEMIMFTHLANVVPKQDAIYDRCLIDGYVYTVKQHMDGNCSEECVTTAATILDNNINRYDLIFLLEASFPMEEDGIRPIKPEYRVGIETIMNDTIKQFNIPIIRVDGTVEERLQQIKKYVEES